MPQQLQHQLRQLQQLQQLRQLQQFQQIQQLQQLQRGERGGRGERGDEADGRMGRSERVHQAGKNPAGHQLGSHGWPEILDRFIPIQQAASKIKLTCIKDLLNAYAYDASYMYVRHHTSDIRASCCSAKLLLGALYTSCTPAAPETAAPLFLRVLCADTAPPTLRCYLRAPPCAILISDAQPDVIGAQSSAESIAAWSIFASRSCTSAPVCSAAASTSSLPL